MKSDESLGDFVDIFIHLFYDFSKEYVDWDFMGERFHYSVHISLE